MQKSLKNGGRTEIPTPALVLGLAGLIPFAMIPLAVALEGSGLVPDVARAHVTVPALMLYAAIILSFMGGVQWGIAIRSMDDGLSTAWRRYGVSVLPAIMAWFAVFLATRNALIMLATGFVLLLIYDLWTVRMSEAPDWYERLRLILTTAVVISLTVTVALLT